MIKINYGKITTSSDIINIKDELQAYKYKLILNSLKNILSVEVQGKDLNMCSNIDTLKTLAYIKDIYYYTDDEYITFINNGYQFNFNNNPNNYVSSEIIYRLLKSNYFIKDNEDINIDQNIINIDKYIDKIKYINRKEEELPLNHQQAIILLQYKKEELNNLKIKQKALTMI